MASENNRESNIWRFAQLFKSYGIALGIIVAAIPFVTQGLDLLPIYASSKSILTFLTSLVSLLAVAILFTIRRRVGNFVFPSGRRVLSREETRLRRKWQIFYPLVMMVVSLVSLISYIAFNNASVEQAALENAYEASTGRSLHELLGEKDVVEARLFGLVDQEAIVNGQAHIVVSEGVEKRQLSVSFLSQRGIELVLELTPSVEIPYYWALHISYLLMFIGAAMAFVWLGIIEYIQEVLGIRDRDLLENPYKVAVLHPFRIPEIKDISGGNQDIYFTLEYDPEAKNKKIISGPEGPFCVQHRQKLEYFLQLEGSYWWTCRREVDKKIESHEFRFEYDSMSIIKLIKDAASKELKSLT